MNRSFRKTKILATVGPASDNPQIISDLIRAGANGIRLNFSHGTHDYFRPIIQSIRQISAQLGIPVAILQDLQGPKIRTGKLKNGMPVELKAGAKLTITTREIEGTESLISTTYSELAKDVRPGERILIDDGAIELCVVRSTDTEIETDVVVGGTLREKKGMNLPGVRVSAPALTEKDMADAVFGMECGVDFIALSFVRTAKDVIRLRELLRQEHHGQIRVIAKIEKPEAIENLNEILDSSDGVMVARGDLGVELPAETVPLLQKMIIERANKAEKLVFTATQMLESMVNNLKPTRAEASDVANAILDGTDVVMLSQETAIGQHPVKAVEMMASIARYTESDRNLSHYAERLRPKRIPGFTHAIVCSAREAAEELKAKAMLVFTQSGMTAQMASCQRPQCIIYAFAVDPCVYQQLSLQWGTCPILFESATSTEAMIKKAEEILLDLKAVQSGDVLVIISGTQQVQGATNMLKIERVS